MLWLLASLPALTGALRLAPLSAAPTVRHAAPVMQVRESLVAQQQGMLAFPGSRGDMYGMGRYGMGYGMGMGMGGYGPMRGGYGYGMGGYGMGGYGMGGYGMGRYGMGGYGGYGMGMGYGGYGASRDSLTRACRPSWLQHPLPTAFAPSHALSAYPRLTESCPA